jgi:Survival protein SurE
VSRKIPALVIGVFAVLGTLGVDAVPASAAPKPPTLRVLVTNDDGVAAPGIDALVEGHLGPVAYVSGTVGAARTAVRRGVPAVAVSQGSGEAPDYPAGVREAVRWVKEHRKALTKKDVTPPRDVANLNVPTCTVGMVRGHIEVPSATTGDVGRRPNCGSKVKRPVDDVIAYANGFAALSPVPPTQP